MAQFSRMAQVSCILVLTGCCSRSFAATDVRFSERNAENEASSSALSEKLHTVPVSCEWLFSNDVTGD